MNQTILNLPLRKGSRVLITRGALAGNWGLVSGEHPDHPGFWYVRLANSDHPSDLRLLATGQLQPVTPTPAP